MLGKCYSYHIRQLFIVDTSYVAVGDLMKNRRHRVMEIILEEIHKRAKMVHEIRDMGEDLLRDMKRRHNKETQNEDFKS